jgi:hypothetical protein
MKMMSECRTTWDGEAPVFAPACSKRGYFEALRFQTVKGNFREMFRAMGVPITPSPRKPTRVMVETIRILLLHRVLQGS